MTCHKLVQAASATRAPGCLASFPWSKIDKHIPLRPDVAGRARSQFTRSRRGSGEVCASFLIVSWSYYERSRKRYFWGMLQWNWIELHPFSHHVISTGYSETARRLHVCENACVCEHKWRKCCDWQTWGKLRYVPFDNLFLDLLPADLHFISYSTCPLLIG